LYAEALRLRRELGDDWGIVVALDNLGAVACEMGEYATACAHYAEALALAQSIHATRMMVEVLAGLGRLAAREGQPTRAVELLAFALGHPAMGSEAREPAARALADLETQMPRAEFDAAVERGRTLELEALVSQALMPTGNGVPKPPCWP